MSYLSKLLNLYRSSSQRKQKLDSNIAHDEPLARFLHEKHKQDKYFNEATGLIKPAAFKPSKNKGLSVYRTKDCPENEVWAIADEFVTGKMQEKPAVLARAKVNASEFASYPVKLDADGDPHPRHLNIKDWPIDPGEIKEITVELARVAILKMRPKQIS